MNSIMQLRKECFVCHKTYDLHKHHVYGGGNRQESEDNVLWCDLCFDHHTGEHGVHKLPRADDALKKLCQEAFEEEHSREDFINLIGKSYL